MQDSTDILQIIRTYNGDTWFFALFLAAMAYLLWRSDRENRRNVILVVICAALLVFNNVAFRAASRFTDSSTYYRFLWMVPVVPILSYVTVDVFIRRRTVLGKMAVLGAAAVLLITAGDSCVNADSFRSRRHVQYLNPYVGEICHLIRQDKEKEYVRVACEFGLVLSIRIQDPTIINAITRDSYLAGSDSPAESRFEKRQRILLKLVDGGEMDPDSLREFFSDSTLDYMVIANEHERDEQMQAAGCSILGKTTAYTIYRIH